MSPVLIPAAPPATPAPIARIEKMSVLVRRSRHWRIWCLRRKCAASCAITPASCASLRILSSNPVKITAMPVGNMTALKSGIRTR